MARLAIFEGCRVACWLPRHAAIMKKKIKDYGGVVLDSADETCTHIVAPPGMALAPALNRWRADAGLGCVLGPRHAALALHFAHVTPNPHLPRRAQWFPQAQREPHCQSQAAPGGGRPGAVCHSGMGYPEHSGHGTGRPNQV